MGALKTDTTGAAGGVPPDPAWLELACLGGALPPAVQTALDAAGAAWNDEPAAEAHLATAYALAPTHPAVYIAQYRYLFYKNRLDEALHTGMRCLARAAADNGLSADWRDVRAAQAEFSGWGVALRFYLFTLKGCAYLSLRLGRVDQGRAMIAKLRELDPKDRLGGSVLEAVLARKGDDDE
jgi:hypothetical protein